MIGPLLAGVTTATILITLGRKFYFLNQTTITVVFCLKMYRWLESKHLKAFKGIQSKHLKAFKGIQGNVFVTFVTFCLGPKTNDLINFHFFTISNCITSSSFNQSLKFDNISKCQSNRMLTKLYNVDQISEV